MSNISRYITVRGQYEGWHEWADAPEPVAFLRNEHRHMFHWEVTIEVFHDDRELEFFLVKLALDTEFKYWIGQRERRHLGSCEMQAEAFLERVKALYGENRYIWISVSEDKENDGIVEWMPHN